jgi:hypothetical protein
MHLVTDTGLYHMAPGTSNRSNQAVALFSGPQGEFPRIVQGVGAD